MPLQQQIACGPDPQLFPGVSLCIRKVLLIRNTWSGVEGAFKTGEINVNNRVRLLK
jgi:hypothetical protein